MTFVSLFYFFFWFCRNVICSAFLAEVLNKLKLKLKTKHTISIDKKITNTFIVGFASRDWLFFPGFPSWKIPRRIHYLLTVTEGVDYVVLNNLISNTSIGGKNCEVCWISVVCSWSFESTFLLYFCRRH